MRMNERLPAANMGQGMDGIFVGDLPPPTSAAENGSTPVMMRGSNFPFSYTSTYTPSPLTTHQTQPLEPARIAREGMDSRRTAAEHFYGKTGGHTEDGSKFRQEKSVRRDQNHPLRGLRPVGDVSPRVCDPRPQRRQSIRRDSILAREGVSYAANGGRRSSSNRTERGGQLQRRGFQSDVSQGGSPTRMSRAELSKTRPRKTSERQWAATADRRWTTDGRDALDFRSSLSTASDFGGKDSEASDAVESTVRFYKTRMCVFHQQGLCSKDSVKELQTVPNLAKTRICEDWLRGHCRSKRCKFAHGAQELRETDLSALLSSSLNQNANAYGLSSKTLPLTSPLAPALTRTAASLSSPSEEWPNRGASPFKSCGENENSPITSFLEFPHFFPQSSIAAFDEPADPASHFLSPSPPSPLSLSPSPSTASSPFQSSRQVFSAQKGGPHRLSSPNDETNVIREDPFVTGHLPSTRSWNGAASVDVRHRPFQSEAAAAPRQFDPSAALSPNDDQVLMWERLTMKDWSIGMRSLCDTSWNGIWGPDPAWPANGSKHVDGNRGSLPEATLPASGFDEANANVSRNERGRGRVEASEGETENEGEVDVMNLIPSPFEDAIGHDVTSAHEYLNDLLPPPSEILGPWAPPASPLRPSKSKALLTQLTRQSTPAQSAPPLDSRLHELQKAVAMAEEARLLATRAAQIFRECVGSSGDGRTEMEGDGALTSFDGGTFSPTNAIRGGTHFQPSDTQSRQSAFEGQALMQTATSSWSPQEVSRRALPIKSTLPSVQGIEREIMLSECKTVDSPTNRADFSIQSPTHSPHTKYPPHTMCVANADERTRALRQYRGHGPAPQERGMMNHP